MAVKALVREPVADAVDLAHFRDRILQQRQQHVDAVEHDPLRADLLLLRREHGQHSGQVEVAGLDERGRQVGVQEEQLLCREACQPPVEGGAIGDDLAGAFLERDENAGRALPARGVDETLQANTVLPAPGPPMSRVVRWRGNPPRLSSSNPSMPVASLSRGCVVLGLSSRSRISFVGEDVVEPVGASVCSPAHIVRYPRRGYYLTRLKRAGRLGRVLGHDEIDDAEKALTGGRIVPRQPVLDVFDRLKVDGEPPSCAALILVSGSTWMQILVVVIGAVLANNLPCCVPVPLMYVSAQSGRAVVRILGSWTLSQSSRRSFRR